MPDARGPSRLGIVGVIVSIIALSGCADEPPAEVFTGSGCSSTTDSVHVSTAGATLTIEGIGLLGQRLGVTNERSGHLGFQFEPEGNMIVVASEGDVFVVIGVHTANGRLLVTDGTGQELTSCPAVIADETISVIAVPVPPTEIALESEDTTFRLPQDQIDQVFESGGMTIAMFDP